jgi:hypothetical protein
MKTTILTTLFMLLALTIGTTASANGNIECQVDRMGKTFSISTNTITLRGDESENGRAIASIAAIRTRRSGNGFTKIMNFEGHKYGLHIEDTNSFSEVNDYITIRSSRGHEVTYPISCQRM